MRYLTALGLLLLIVIATTGCAEDDQSGSSTAERPTTERSSPEAALEGAAREALKANFRLAGYVLWHNRVPPKARNTTRGPALAQMQASVARAKKEGVRIRTLTSTFRIVDLDVSPSYTTAQATVQQRGRVRIYRRGRPLGRSVRSDERARVQLRRVGKTVAFVVWKVRVTK